MNLNTYYKVYKSLSMADLKVLDVNVPESYQLYTQYLDQLKTFYDILGNTMYDTRILPDRTVFYKEKKSDTWVKIVPPKFDNQEQVLEQWNDLKASVQKIQQAQADIFFQDQSQISPETINQYNDLVSKSDLIDQEIKKLTESESPDLTEKIQQLTAGKYQILGGVTGHNDANSLNNLMELRQASYTWKGDTLSDYNQWKEKWVGTTEYQNWVKANSLYYQQLEKLQKTNKSLAKHINLETQLEDFGEYKMTAKPAYDPQSAGPGTQTLKTLEVKKPLQPKPKPQTKPVVAPPTPVNLPPTPVNAPPTPAKIPVTQKIPIATKTPIKTKVPIATKVPAPAPVDEPVPTPAPVAKEVNHKDVITTYIKGLGKPDVESKIKVSSIEKLLQIMAEKNVVPSFPQVGLFISQMKQENNPSYMEIAKSGINHMTFKSLLNNIYAKINGK